MRQLQLQLQQQADGIQAGAWQEEDAREAQTWQQQSAFAALEEDEWQEAARPQLRGAAGRGAQGRGAGRSGPIPAGGRGSGDTPVSNPGGVLCSPHAVRAGSHLLSLCCGSHATLLLHACERAGSACPKHPRLPLLWLTNTLCGAGLWLGWIEMSVEKAQLAAALSR